MIVSNSYAQTKTSYKPQAHEKKYFISLSGSYAQAKWKSSIDGTPLYNGKGNPITSGSFHFNAKNITTATNIEVLAPVSVVRLGLGICFENFKLDRLIVQQNGNTLYYPFFESFRMDKITLSCEYPLPLKFTEKSRFTIDAVAKGGYFGFVNVKSVNLFGGPYIPRSFFTGLGLMVDCEVIEHIYLFVTPYYEFKFFSNSPQESPQIIKHHINSLGLNFGIRYNPN